MNIRTMVNDHQDKGQSTVSQHYDYGQSTSGQRSNNTRTMVNQHQDKGQSMLGQGSVNTRTTVYQHQDNSQSTSGQWPINTRTRVNQYLDNGQSTGIVAKSGISGCILIFEWSRYQNHVGRLTQTDISDNIITKSILQRLYSIRLYDKGNVLTRWLKLTLLQRWYLKNNILIKTIP